MAGTVMEAQDKFFLALLGTFMLIVVVIEGSRHKKIPAVRVNEMTPPSPLKLDEPWYTANLPTCRENDNRVPIVGIME